jgi:periplasmic copper chaperone A
MRASPRRVVGEGSVATKKLATPIQTDDANITEGVDTITWTALSKRDAIPPAAFQDFGLR